MNLWRFELDLSPRAWLPLIAVVACRSAPPAIAPPEPVGMAADIAYLASPALAGRAAGTPGNDSAAVFLARRHEALGLPGAFHGECAAGTSCSVSYFQYFHGREAAGHNVGAFVRGSDPERLREIVIVGAHYDHLGEFSRFALDPEVSAPRLGADDNASGTAAVLELARRLAANPPPRSVLLVHFDAEEWGMVGSRAFVQQPPVPVSTMVFMLNLDMVGRLNGRGLLIDGSAADLATRALADSVAHAVGVKAARWN